MPLQDHMQPIATHLAHDLVSVGLRPQREEKG
jgi:hypothetical protein